MIKRKIQTVLLTFSVAFFIFGLSIQTVQASSFFDARSVMYGEWTEANWVFFGGCENGGYGNYECISSADGNSFFSIGNYGVKQGVYQLGSGYVSHQHGRMVLQYSYKIETAESSGSTNDVVVIKVKDIDTEEELYKETLTSADDTDGWVNVKERFSGVNAARRLQLVFEITNDAEDLTVLSVDSITFQHESEPQIEGTVTYKESGKIFYAEGATVALQNKKRTKTINVTQTDADGKFTFFPVERKKMYVLAVTYGERTGLKEMKKKTRWNRTYPNPLRPGSRTIRVYK